MRPVLAAFALVLAGCVTLEADAPAPLPVDVDDVFANAIVQTHDHEDASLHTGSHGLRFVAWDPLIPDEIGEEGFAGMRIVDGLAYLATDGAHAGFLIVDVRDPRAPKLVSQYSTPGGASQEAVPTPDGEWVFLNLQRAPGPLDLVGAPERGHGNGIQIVDVRDKENPRFESFVPVEVRGSHVMFYHEMHGKGYLFYNGQPARQGLPTGDVYTPPPGNVVKVAEFAEVGGKRTLVPVGEFRYSGSLTARVEQGCFPHDMWVEEHPRTGQHVMYVAHWDCGMVTVDVTDPAHPVELGVWDDPAPSAKNRIHFVRPDPVERDGRVVAWSGPEIDLSAGEPGWLRAYDVTDPAAPEQIGAWRLPSDVENDQPFIFTPHNFDYRGDLLAVAHYHAGVWILDVSDPENPRHLAYYLPHGEHGQPFEGEVWRKTPNFPIAYLPNVYEVRWHDGVDGETYLLVSERGTGLYVLQLEDGLRSG